MVEQIRTVRITVYVNTNKRTIEESFDNMDDAKTYFDDLMESL